MPEDFKGPPAVEKYVGNSPEGRFDGEAGQMMKYVKLLGEQELQRLAQNLYKNTTVICVDVRRTDSLAIGEALVVDVLLEDNSDYTLKTDVIYYRDYSIACLCTELPDTDMPAILEEYRMQLKKRFGNEYALDLEAFLIQQEEE